MPLTRSDLLARLADLGIETTTVEHPPLFTVADSQALRGELPGGHAKNLFVKDRKDRLFLLVVPEDATVDLKRVHERIGGNGKVSFGKPELLMEVLGVVPGAVTPFGAVNDTEGRVTVVLDAGLMRADPLNFHPLDNTATTTIARDDLVKALTAWGHPPAILAVAEEAIAAGL